VIESGSKILSAIIWFPFIGALILMLLPKSVAKFAKPMALGVSLVTLFGAYQLIQTFKPGTFHFQFGERFDWLPALGITYSVGLDGMSLWMFALTALLGVFAVLVGDAKVDRPASFFALVLALETTMLGVFAALDLVLFYTFFELSLAPVALLILGWGSQGSEVEARKKAAIRYFAALFAGSILMLVGIVLLSQLQLQATGKLSFHLLDIQASVANGTLWAKAMGLQAPIFWTFALAFLVKSPGVPFHSWLTSTYRHAPIAALVGGVVIKLGTYGLFRFCLPLFPDVIGDAVPTLMLIGAVGIIYGGIVAAGQQGVNKLMAFATVSHVGFVVVGLFSLTANGVAGAAFQQFSLGLVGAATFVLLSFLYQRKGTQDLSSFGALKRQMPYFATLFLVVMLANLGLPFTIGFVGEFQALMGAFQASVEGINGLQVGVAAVAGFGVVLSAVYMLYMFQKLFYGKAEEGSEPLNDLNAGELVIGGILVAMLIGFGVAPSRVQQDMDLSLQATRLMAINAVNERPIWSELDHEITSGETAGAPGSLVSIEDRVAASVGTAQGNGSPISAPKLHPTKDDLKKAVEQTELQASAEGVNPAQ